MKKLIFLISFLTVFQGAIAQWTTVGSDIYNSNTGNVGINTTSPSTKLEIVSPSGIVSPVIVRGDGLPIVSQIFASSSGDPFHSPGFATGRSRGTYASKSNVSAGDRIGVFAAAQWLNSAYQTSASIEFFAGTGVSNSAFPADIRFLTTATGGTTRVQRMMISQDGYVGVGTSSPTTAFHVAGSVRIVDGTQGVGKVLSSDANGVGSWVNVSAVAGGWGLTGNSGTVDGTSFLGTTDNVPFSIRVNSQKAARIDHILKNTIWGYKAGASLTTGTENVIIGQEAMTLATTATYNTSVGLNSLISLTTGNSNTAVGNRALQTTTSGAANVGVGIYAGNLISTGSDNVMIGDLAGASITTGSSNTFVGAGADGGPSMTNASGFGYGAAPAGSNQIQIGNSSITKIGGQVGWSSPSDARFKTNIKENAPGLDFINQLRAVTYNFDVKAFETFKGVKTTPSTGSTEKRSNPLYSGFIAQEVDQIVKKGQFTFSGVVEPADDKDYYSLRYSDFVVPLVKAVQELSRKVTEQQSAIDILTAKVINTPQSEGKKFSDGSLVLAQNFPNPYTTDTEIKMILPDAVQTAVVIVYNLQGAQLKSIPVTKRGDASVKISGSELQAGMYLYTLIADGIVVDTKRMILVK